MNSLEHLTRQTDPADIWTALDKQGGVIVDSFLDENGATVIALLAGTCATPVGV